MPTDPRTLVVSGVNTNPSAAIQFNAFWTDLHNPPAPYVRNSSLVPNNPTTCGEYRASRNQGEWNMMSRQYFQYFIGTSGYNRLWLQWDNGDTAGSVGYADIFERPADFEAQIIARYGLHVAPWDNPYPKCDQWGTNCENPADPAHPGGTGQLPLGLVQGRGVCSGGPLNGLACDYGGYAGAGYVSACGSGYSCIDQYNGTIAVSCNGCHDSQFLPTFKWGRTNDSGDAGMAQSDIVLASGLGILELAPLPWSVGRGATDAIGIIDLLPAILDMNSLLLAPSIAEFFPTAAAGMSRAPNWWYRAFKTRQFWEGALTSDNVRSEMAFGIANLGRTGPSRRALAAEFEDIDNFLLSLSPPLYPYSITTTLAEKGAKLFHERDLWSSTSRLCAGGTNAGGFCTTNADCPSSTCGTASTKTCDRGANEGQECTSDAFCGTGNKCTFGSSPDPIDGKSSFADVCESGPSQGQACTQDSNCGIASTYYVCNDTPNGGTGYPGVAPRGGQVCSTDATVTSSEHAFCNAAVCWGGSKNGQLCGSQPAGWCGLFVTCGGDIMPPNPACDAAVNTYYRCVNPQIPKPAGNGSCASCHGVYSPTYASNTAYLPSPALKGVAGVITPIATIQTAGQRKSLMDDARKRRTWNSSFLAYTEQATGGATSNGAQWNGFLPSTLEGFFESELFQRPNRAYYDNNGTCNGIYCDPVGPNTWIVPSGYLATPLYGAWAAAPYFHNGSVPTIEAVLAPWKRPSVWQRPQTEGFTQKRYLNGSTGSTADITGLNKNFARNFNPSNSADPTNSYDWTNLGWKYTNLSCDGTSNLPCNDSQAGTHQKFTQWLNTTTYTNPAQTLTNWVATLLAPVSSLFYQSVPPMTNSLIPARMVFNGKLYANSPIGHRFTQSLTADERAAIIEYLKTL